MTVETRRWQFTVADFERMAQAGIFEENDRVELIEGEVRAMSPIGPRHAAIVNRLNMLLNRLLADRAIVSVQNPIRLTDYTEPQPDVAVLRPREDFYAEGHAGPEDVLLVVEVADVSLEYDLEEKIPRYAQAGIPEVWLIDVEAEAVVQYTRPEGARYGNEQRQERRQRVISQSVSSLELGVDEMMG